MRPDTIAERLSARFRRYGRVMTYDEWQLRLNRIMARRKTDMSPRAMRQIVDVAIEVLGDIYAHIDLKRSRRGVDPVQQLKVVRERIDTSTTERTFHATMLRIFKSLGDMHTAYRLPKPYIRTVAFLPFCLAEYSDSRGRLRYVVTHVISGVAPRGFRRGTEVITYNGVPIAAAVRASGASEEGSNAGSDLSLGVQSLTVKWLGAAFEPEGGAVTVGYLSDRREVTAALPWLMLEFKADPRYVLVVASQATDRIFQTSHPHDWAIHLGSGLVHRTRMAVFKQTSSRQPRRGLASLGKKLKTLGEEYLDRHLLRRFTERAGLSPGGSGEVPTLLPLFFEAREFDGTELAGGRARRGRRRARRPEASRIAYIRIRAFPIEGLPRELFLHEFRRLLNTVSGDGLILDIRDNPGGSANNAETALQFLLPCEITPLPFRFLASPVTRRLVAHHQTIEHPYDYRPYEPSLDMALDTGGRFSAGLPLTNPAEANKLGQQYFGPVVLLVNAGTYSAADVFAAGFEDHGGTILNTDATTGAGGANVWFYDANIAEGLKKPPIPAGVNLQVAARQCTRTGKNTGIPIEEIGVPALHRHSLTREDVLAEDGTPTPLLRKASALMPSKRRCDLETDLVTRDQRHTITVRTREIDRLDFYVNGRPIESADVDRAAGTTVVTFPADQARELVVLIRGFFDGGRKPTGSSAPVFTLVARVVRQIPAVGTEA